MCPQPGRGPVPLTAAVAGCRRPCGQPHRPLGDRPSSAVELLRRGQPDHPVPDRAGTGGPEAVRQPVPERAARPVPGGGRTAHRYRSAVTGTGSGCLNRGPGRRAVPAGTAPVPAAPAPVPAMPARRVPVPARCGTGGVRAAPGLRDAGGSVTRPVRTRTGIRRRPGPRTPSGAPPIGHLTQLAPPPVGRSTGAIPAGWVPNQKPVGYPTRQLGRGRRPLPNPVGWGSQLSWVPQTAGWVPVGWPVPADRCARGSSWAMGGREHKPPGAGAAPAHD